MDREFPTTEPGVTAMLAIAALLRAVRIRHALPFLFIGNVGEEGEGDLRGMRHIFATPRWKDSIAYSLILDGAGSDTIVAEALGSRRFEMIVRGPGGHSWSDFGAPNPIVILARAIESFCQTPVPATPKSTFNIGVIRGGTSVNSIPESASMRVDLRSTSMTELERLERSLRVCLDQAVERRTTSSARRAARPTQNPCRDQRSGGDRRSSGGRTGPECAHPASHSRGRLPTWAMWRRCSAPRPTPISRSSLGREAHCHRRRRFRRRRSHPAGMVRLQRRELGIEDEFCSHYSRWPEWANELENGSRPAVAACWQRAGAGASRKPKADIIFIHGNVYTGRASNIRIQSRSSARKRLPSAEIASKPSGRMPRF